MCKCSVENYEDYVISTSEEVEIGLFFRNPLQKIQFYADIDYFTDAPDKVSAWIYLYSLQNPIKKLYEILIGNKDIVKNIDNWSKNYDWAGFSANILCSPIYFKRKCRRLIAISCNDSKNIKEIHSYGYEGPYNMCAGACQKEKTIVTLKNGKDFKINVKDKYKFTYIDSVEKLIKNDKLFL